MADSLPRMQSIDPSGVQPLTLQMLRLARATRAFLATLPKPLELWEALVLSQTQKMFLRCCLDPAHPEFQPASQKHLLGLGQNQGLPEFERFGQGGGEGLAGAGQPEDWKRQRLDPGRIYGLHPRQRISHRVSRSRGGPPSALPSG